MWILHFLSHLKEGGTAGFVMATGELSNSETARLEVRTALVEQNYVDCIVQLSGQLFANTQIPCALWFLSKSRKGGNGLRKRTGEVLFIDGRKLGTLIPGSRKQKQLSTDELKRVASTYRQFRRESVPEEVAGFSKVADIDAIRANRYALASARYVGSADSDEEELPIQERLPRLLGAVRAHLAESRELEKRLTKIMDTLDHG